MSPARRSEIIKAIAAEVGFELCGLAQVGPIKHREYVKEWLCRGLHGSMEYLQRNHQFRLDPSGLLANAKSMVCVALNYRPNPCDEHSLTQAESNDPNVCAKGRVARYAWGEDYHVVVREKLRVMVDQMRGEMEEPFEVRICVDTAPIVEREIATSAGLGWIGKNTLVLDSKLGSYFFLGEILTTLDLAPDEPVADHCGSCTACLDACPTKAFPKPYEMDASRCISYLTIEHRGDISKPFQEMMGDWIFGCDVCQEVCPFNREAAPTREAKFSLIAPKGVPTVTDVARWDDEEYRRAVEGRALDRATLPMWKRNARIAAENFKRDSHPDTRSES